MRKILKLLLFINIILLISCTSELPYDPSSATTPFELTIRVVDFGTKALAPSANVTFIAIRRESKTESSLISSASFVNTITVALQPGKYSVKVTHSTGIAENVIEGKGGEKLSTTINI